MFVHILGHALPLSEFSAECVTYRVCACVYILVLCESKMWMCACVLSVHTHPHRQSYQDGQVFLSATICEGRQLEDLSRTLCGSV